MVKAKKYLGQHFLRDETIAEDITHALKDRGQPVLEIGPGTGVLTKYLIERFGQRLFLIDLDEESVNYLHKNYPGVKNQTYFADFLRSPLAFLPDGKYSIIGNFPYNISSQIFFKVLDHKERVDEVVCMLQKEVAVRLASPPGNKNYGILSVLLQAFYEIEFLFSVPPEVFQPPPKVESGVIRLVRSHNNEPDCDLGLFKKIVKQGFQNRRKTLRNALKPLNLPTEVSSLPLLDRRAETLSVSDFEYLTLAVERGAADHTL